MADVPLEVQERCRDYCSDRGVEVEPELRGFGVDGFVWQTTQDAILKVFRHDRAFRAELAVYRRLESHGIERLQGFRIPILLDYDAEHLVLELSYVEPPYVLDFASATLDAPPPGFDPELEEWIDEKRRLFGEDWPRVARLLDALRRLGIHYADVHRENIRLGP